LKSAISFADNKISSLILLWINDNFNLFDYRA
jgi:hypothetical protein